MVNALKFLWEKWKKFAFKFGEFMSGVILTLFYFLIVTPHAILLKLFSDPLKIKKIHKTNGWHDKKPSSLNFEDAFKQ